MHASEGLRAPFDHDGAGVEHGGPNRVDAGSADGGQADSAKRFNDLGIGLLSFEVKGEPLADVVKRLRDMGVNFFSDLEEIDIAGYAPMKAVIFEDPDGNLLELVQLPSKEEYLRIKQEREARAAK